MVSPELLRRFTLFAGLPPAIFKDIAMLGDEISVKAGEWLFAQNDSADALYLILKGKVELKIATDEEKPNIIAEKKLSDYVDLTTLIEGEVIGWSALLDPYVYTLGATAETDVQLIKLDCEKLLELMKDNPQTGYIFMTRVAKALAERLTNMRVRFVSIAS